MVQEWLANEVISEWDLYRVTSKQGGLEPGEAINLLTELGYAPTGDWPLRRDNETDTDPTQVDTILTHGRENGRAKISR
jgi:hypothetical protein